MIYELASLVLHRGQKVRICTIEELKERFPKKQRAIDIRYEWEMGENISFVSDMYKYCGKEVEIKNVWSYSKNTTYVEMEGIRWTWVPEVLCFPNLLENGDVKKEMLPLKLRQIVR